MAIDVNHMRRKIVDHCQSKIQYIDNARAERGNLAWKSLRERMVMEFVIEMLEVDPTIVGRTIDSMVASGKWRPTLLTRDRPEEGDADGYQARAGS